MESIRSRESLSDEDFGQLIEEFDQWVYFSRKRDEAEKNDDMDDYEMFRHDALEAGGIVECILRIGSDEEDDEWWENRENWVSILVKEILQEPDHEGVLDGLKLE